MIYNKIAMTPFEVLNISYIIRQNKLMRLNLKAMFQTFLILSKQILQLRAWCME